jgi:hypothetical protein
MRAREEVLEGQGENHGRTTESRMSEERSKQIQEQRTIAGSVDEDGSIMHRI